MAHSKAMGGMLSEGYDGAMSVPRRLTYDQSTSRTTRKQLRLAARYALLVPFQYPRALVVDDHADAADAFAGLLRMMGCETMSVTDPFLALDAADQFKAQVVFLDIGMPGLDGFELARRLRAQYGFDNLRIVAVTGYGEEEHRTLSRQAGFDAHVVKPIDIHLVESMLRTLFPG